MLSGVIGFVTTSPVDVGHPELPMAILARRSVPTVLFIVPPPPPIVGMPRFFPARLGAVARGAGIHNIESRAAILAPAA